MKQPADPVPEPRSTSSPRILKLATRIVLAVLAGVGLGLAAYYGLPAIYSSYVQPVQDNTQRIAEVEKSFESDLETQQTRLEALEARLIQVETDLAAAVETLEAVQKDLQELLTALGEERGDLQRIRALETELETMAEALEAAETRLTEVEGTVEESQAPMAALEERVQLLLAMELVLRARLALADNNPGLAGQDLRRARGILVSTGAPDSWSSIVTRLDMALANLNSAPLAAQQDIEAAWYLMLEASAP
ncbi:MAG TPA: hypothetical protein VFI11_00065 [Anaerolineales bacterium]|nr:hypothetical protein [Anaerolineales bacterium]